MTGARVRALAGRPRAQAGAATLFYLAYAVFLTWPVVLDLDTSIYGEAPGDLTGSIAYVREVIQQDGFPFAPLSLRDFNAPTGLEVGWVLNLATLPGTALLYALCYLAGPTAGHTVFTLTGYVLSGLAMFLLARRVTASAGAALIAGFAFAFYPYAVSKGLGHIHFVHGWVLVLLIWRVLELGDRPTLRNGMLAGVAAAFAMWFTPYFILIGFVAYVAAVAAVMLRAWARRGLRELLPGLVAASGCVVALVGGLVALQLAAGGDSGGGERAHPISDLTAFSARPHEYVVPDRNNLLFETEAFLAERLHGSNFSENSLYLGLSVILLAFAGAWLVWRDLRRLGRRGLDAVQASAALIAATVAVAGLAFSAPPQIGIGGHLIPAPAWFVFQVTSTWRVYSRFVTIVVLGLAILAAVAVAALLRRRRPRTAGAVVVMLLIVVAVDLWARAPGAVTTPVPPSIYATLAGLPTGTVAEYPIEPAVVPNATAVFYQDAHGKPILNGFGAGTADESRKLELVDLGDRETPGALAAFGVRYVLAHTDYRGAPAGRGYRLIAEDPTGRIYEVTAAPAKVGVDGLDGFWLVEGAPDQQSRWLVSYQGRVLVWADCDSCRGSLEFESSSFARPRELRILDSSGRELHRQTIGLVGGLVRVPLAFQRRTELTFQIDPAPEPATPDPRQLGITLFEPKFVRR